MAQELRGIAAFTEDSSLDLSPRTAIKGSSQVNVTPAPRNLAPSSGSMGTCTHVCTCIYLV